MVVGLEACGFQGSIFHAHHSWNADDVVVSQAAEPAQRLKKLTYLEALGDVLNQLGVLRGFTYRLARSRLDAVLRAEVKAGVESGEVKAGSVPGLDPHTMLIQVEDSAAELWQKESQARDSFQSQLSKVYHGSGSFTFTEDELLGVPEKLRAGWARRGKYKVPIGRDALQCVVAHCAAAGPRRKLFEAYYQQAGSGLHEAALELLRVRLELSGVGQKVSGSWNIIAFSQPPESRDGAAEGPEGLELQEEGLTVLRRVGSPLHVAFAIGGSRCGKSTACNALLLGPDASDRSCFETGSAFDPVTVGVDVAARRLPGGGALVLADCEGAFHLCGSTLNARGFGDVGFLAYHLSSTVIHVTMGSIDERDLEALGHLATDAGELRCSAPECLRPDAVPPELLLLVNGARFELGDAVARRLLQPPAGSGRQCARSAISRVFGAEPALEALPGCEHAGYWPKVERLRERLLEAAPVAQGPLQASGSQVARRLEALVAHLGGAEPPAGPISAAEHSLRSRLLDPLVEEIAKKFTTAASSWRPNQVSSPSSADAREDESAVEEALREFDERSAWLAEGVEEEAGALPAELLRAVRQRLAARLQGIAEAVARGREESAALRRQGSASKRDRGTPSRLERSPGSQLEFRTPTPPHTPSRRRTLAALLGAAEEAVLRVEAFHAAANHQAKELREIYGEATIQATARSEAAQQEDVEAMEEVAQWQEEWERRLSQEAAVVRQRAQRWTAKCQEMVDDLSSQLHSIKGQLPDVLSGAVVLERVRSDLEVMRVGRREVLEKASKRVAARMEELRESCAFESSGHAELQSRISTELGQRMGVLHQLLKEESAHRRERHQALVEVVAQMSKSLEATMLSEEGRTLTPSPASHAKSLRTPGGRWKSDKLSVNGLLRRSLRYH
ncbi:unnamed protein product [Symbiodinium natans]|uniref:Guanylate-binding protein N-terminal domain-containing protein n=1 Tax=Symbiodinium natans TaxID=878477 RepID=A0A812PJR4_9DINO|nr:unnamed protein product [Symbiodinium natans]